MTSLTKCLECGTELTSAEASGLCPKCMLTLGLASQLASGTLPVTARGLTEDGTIIEPFDFGRYKILRLMGKGGMGAVYEAEDLETQRRVALKVLGHSLDSAEMRARFLREGQIAASISHPNVVGVFCAHEIEKTPVIAMELVLDGTLKDRVKRKGPLPVGEAVDLILQMIDGLEAAHTAGVLHRDIKPANCFITPDGVAKIGDFGLSISTLARAEMELTSVGAVLGTPAFAAPEQLRGAEVDVRADIYAVGATLYYLLTGRQTHDADTLVSLIAAVLEKVPRNPREIRSDLPRGLARIVMRCLEKNPMQRPQSYHELRSALLPYSSLASTPVTIGLRVLAGIVDNVLIALPAMVYLAVYDRSPEEIAVNERTLDAILVFLAFWLFQVACYAIQETVWGTSLGKALCGLRVSRINRAEDLGLWRPIARAIIFYLPLLLETAVVAAIYIPPYIERALQDAGLSRSAFITGLWFLVLFVTMRRKNGFAAVHDLLTGTRVVAQPAIEVRPGLNIAAAPQFELGAEQIGPFAVVVRRNDGLVYAWDRTLRRPVWIRECTMADPAISSLRRNLSRPTRLRWLAGERSDSGCWDAYESLDGMPLTALMDGQQPWAKVRFWLLDLSEEIHAALSQGLLPSEIGPQHVWITNSGRAVLLEFSAPNGTPMQTVKIKSARETSAFLSWIAGAACTPVIPLHAREFLVNLQNDRFDETAVIAANLRSMTNRPAAFSRKRRLFTLVLPAFLAVCLAIVSGIGIKKIDEQFDTMWAKEFPGRPSLRLVLSAYSTDGGDSEKNQKLVNYVGTHYGDVVSDPRFWKRAETVQSIPEPLQTLAKEAVANKGKLGTANIPPNDSQIAEILGTQARFEKQFALVVVPVMAVLFSSIFLALGALWTLFGRAPFTLHLAGAVLIRKDGQPVSRVRGFLRSLPVLSVACLGILMGIPGTGILLENFLGIGGSSDLNAIVYVGMFAIGCIVLFIGAIIAVRRPERGLSDVIAGTFIVPR